MINRKVPLICISGRSAVGKTVMVAESGLEPLVTHTSRPRRPGEEDGSSYHFRTREWFEANTGRFTNDLVQFNDDYYGAADSDLEGADVLVMTFDKALEFKRNGLPVYLVWVGGPCRGQRTGRKETDDERLESLYHDNTDAVDLVICNTRTIQDAARLLAAAHEHLSGSIRT